MTAVLLVKLALVAASILLASVAARRFGHALGGVVAGMPMIAAPICAILLVDQGAGPVRAIALATLVCIPGSVAHSVTMGWVARWVPWPVAIALSLSVFAAVGLALSALALPAAAAAALALASPALGLAALPRAVHTGPVSVPRREIAARVAFALAMAAAVIAGADALPPVLSGLLLAMPISGTVLPCFTLARHGAHATATLMGGFVLGLHGFATFFLVLYLALGRLDRSWAFVLALAGAAAVAALVRTVRLRLARAGA